MGLRGPPKKPTKLKLVAGNPGHRPLPTAEPNPKPLLTDTPPSQLKGKVARRFWRSVVPKLREAAIVGTTDIAALIMMCECYQHWHSAVELVAAEGVVGPNQKPHVGIRVADSAFAKLKVLLLQFGMTPASRANVNAIEKASQGSSDWDDLDEDFELPTRRS